MRPDPSYLYETVADAAPDVGGGEPAPEATAEAAPETAAAPDYNAMLSSPEGQEALQRSVWETLQGLDYGEEEPPDQQPYYDPFGGLDPLSDEFGQQLGQGLGQILGQFREQMLAEMQGMPALQAAEQQQYNAWATDAFTGIEQQLGAPVADNIRELAITLAAGQRPPEDHPDARFWDPGRGLHSATQSLTQLIAEERAAAVREYQQGLAGNGTTEPPASGTAAIHSEPVPSNMREARLAWERRQGLHD